MHFRSVPELPSTPTPERWLPVVGYEGWYEVSDLGRVRGQARTIACAGGRVQHRKTRILRPGTHHAGGYQNVTLARSGRKTGHQVHVLVLTAFVGPRPDGLEACHSNGDPADNRLANLRWDTASANALDKVAHGTHTFAARTHCPRGHALEMPNLVASLWERRGYRDCLACNRARTTATNRRKRQGEDIHWPALAELYYFDIFRQDLLRTIEAERVVS